MKAILSVTSDPLYSFLLPFAVQSWNRIGVECITFFPYTDKWKDVKTKEKIERRMALVWKACTGANNITYPIMVQSEDREPTYAQVARLYAGALKGIPEDEVLITADCDMAVFGESLLMGDIDRINIYGQDLVDEGQYPMCYIAMQKKLWKQVMGIPDNGYYADLIRDFLEPQYCDHMRGNYWALDQETIFNKIKEAGLHVYGFSRANHPTKFATRRADRDSWPDSHNPDMIDAHLPRPGYLGGNFQKIVKLFRSQYPYLEDMDFAWMDIYLKEFLKTI